MTHYTITEDEGQYIVKTAEHEIPISKALLTGEVREAMLRVMNALQPMAPERKPEQTREELIAEMKPNATLRSIIADDILMRYHTVGSVKETQ